MKFKSKSVVAGREKVTTPAGTFDCFRVEWEMTGATHYSEEMSHKIDKKTTIWVAQGIGPVKHVSTLGAGYTTTELISLKK